MKKACLTSLLLLGVFLAAYYFLLQGRYPHPADRWGALAGGLVMWMTSGLIQNAFIALRQRRAIERDAAGAPPRDGERYAAVGKIEAIGDDLVSPITRTDCVAYEYEISRTVTARNHDRSTVKDYSGFALTPSVISTRNGRIKLLALPQLTSFDPEPANDRKHYEYAIQYLQSATLENMGGLNVKGAVAVLREMLTDDDGSIRKDVRMRDEDLTGWSPTTAAAASEDAFDRIEAGSATSEENDTSDESEEEVADLPFGFEGRDLVERVVRPRSMVCAIGTWSKTKGGLIHDIAKVSLVELFPGDAVTVAKKLRGKAIGYLIGAVLLGGIGNGILFFALEAIKKNG